MRRLIFLPLLTILCYGYSFGQLVSRIDLPPNWSSLSKEKQVSEVYNILDTLRNSVKKRQFIDDFTKTINNKSLLAEAYTLFGGQAQSKSNFLEAERLYLQALSVKKDMPDTEELGRALFRVGYALLLQSKHNDAIDYLLEAKGIFEKNESYARWSTSLITMGEAYYKKGEHEEGLKLLNEGLSLSKEHKYEYGEASALLNKSQLYIEMKLYDQAISNAKESIPTFEKLYAETSAAVYNEGAANANMNIGSAYFYKNESKEALKYYKRALNYENISQSTKLKILNNLSTISLQDEKYENALNIYRDILENGTHLENEELLATTHLNVGNLYYRQEQYKEAKRHLTIAEEIAEKNSNLNLECEAKQLMAYNYHFLGQADKVLTYTEEWRRAEKERMKKVTDAKNEEITLAFNDKLIAEQRQQQSLISLLLTLIGAILSISLIGFYAYRQKNKRKMVEQEKQQKIETILKESENKTIRARLNGIDEERSRISKDLHDSVGMMLTSTKLHFEALSERLSDIEFNNRKRFDRAFELLDQAQQETRRVVHNMANLTLAQHGLVAQVQELADSVKDSGMINVNLDTEGVDTAKRWTPSLETNIYKIIQELVGNAIKSAKASNLDIQIQQIEEKLSLSVKDDGKGFDPNNANAGMGMSTIKERVKNIGGRLNIDSSKEKGTSISIENISLN